MFNLDKKLLLLIHNITFEFFNQKFRRFALRTPGMDFHPLKGREKEYFSVSVNGNWRIIYKFEGNDAILVDYLDYH